MNLVAEKHTRLLKVEDLSGGLSITIKDILEVLAVFDRSSRENQVVICKKEMRNGYSTPEFDSFSLLASTS